MKANNMTTKTKIISTIIISILSIAFINSHMASYQFFKGDGTKTDFNSIVKASKDYDVIFFGEQHTDPVGHWLEFRLLKALYKQDSNNVVVGMEMFEADGQLLIDEYFNGFISQKSFEKEMRLWNNYETDYKPILEFARKHNLRFVATNIPRRYASSVAKKGLSFLDTLDAESKKFIAPLPVKFDAGLRVYKELNEMIGGGNSHGAKHGGTVKKEMPNPKSMHTPKGMVQAGKDSLQKANEKAMQEMKQMMKNHGMAHIAEAQAIKDATMAHFILQNFEDGKKFIHYDGSKHSDYHEGIVWYIKQRRPDLKILVISSVQQENIDSLDDENKRLADFILVTPEDMTQTYR